MDADWPDTDLESDAEDVEAPPGFKAPEEQCALSVDEFANPNADVWLIRAPRDVRARSTAAPALLHCLMSSIALQWRVPPPAV